MRNSYKKLCNSLIWLTTAVIPFSVFAQNGMDFDGTDDYASAANASALVANSTKMTMALWVYPKNNSSGYPDFDGYAGFRNELNADFYILQLQSTNIEARFRNSSGTPYTITYNGLNLNAWNHFVLTYDGTTLKLYHNGALAASTSASGSFSATTLPFNMGYIPFSSNNFYLQGVLDDVALWRRDLSASEVSSLYTSCGPDLNDPDLKLSYEFNQGIAGGNNSTITTVYDTKGNIHASLNNLALTGTTSNFVTGVDTRTGSQITVHSCGPYTVPSGNQSYYANGTFFDTLQGSNGCDSLLIIDLTVDSVDFSVTQNGNTLTSNATGVGYQWIDCDTKAPITGANSKSFTPTQTGNYAVILAKATCWDTSDCYLVTISQADLKENDLSRHFSIFPNPMEDHLIIEVDVDLGDLEIEILDLSGSLIHRSHSKGEKRIYLEPSVPAGCYLLRITSNKGTASYRVIRM